MKTRSLILAVTIGTLIIWLVFALLLGKFALLPLHAFSTSIGGGKKEIGEVILTVVPYLFFPIIAWMMKWRWAIWIIPLTPIIGGGIWFARYATGMSNFN